jgi:hypothetical protein
MTTFSISRAAIVAVAAVSIIAGDAFAEDAPPTTKPTTRKATTRRAAVQKPVGPKRGEVLALTRDSITAMPYLPAMATDREGPKPETYAIDADTRVRLSEVTSERTNEQGQVVRSIALVDGTLDDLKVGQLVRIRGEEGRAVVIEVLPDFMGQR